MTSTCKSKGGLFLENYVIHQLSLLFFHDCNRCQIKSPATDRENQRTLSLHLKMDLKSERASILESVLGSKTETKT